MTYQDTLQTRRGYTSPGACQQDANVDNTSPMSVVLLHGLGRSAASMLPLGIAAKKSGHVVIRPNYPSLRHAPEELLRGWINPALNKAREADAGPVNVITHSLGGILLRLAIGGEAPDWLGRVVMICPPNGGSEIVDFLNRHKLSSLFIGPTGRTLGTKSGSLPLRLPPIPFECGIICADRWLNPLSDAILPRPHDGKVSLASMQSAKASSFVLVHTSHTFSMMNGNVKRMALNFVETGAFE